MDKLAFVIVALVATHFQIGTGQNVTKNIRNNFCTGECNNNICQNTPDNTSLPNNGSCTQFFICIDGNPQPNTCPQGQWYNEKDNKCDSASNDKCNPKDEFECPRDGIFFFPHEEFCDKYYMCFAGFPILTHCADGLYFDRDQLVCNVAENVECKLEKCPADEEPGKITFLPSDSHCERYYICYNGNPLEQYCAPGIHWNSETEQCDFAENAKCTIEEQKEPESPLPDEIDCRDGIYFQEHPNSCQHYFICSFGHSILLGCAPGLQYDPDNYWCDLADNLQVKCNAGNRLVADAIVLGIDEMAFDTLL